MVPPRLWPATTAVRPVRSRTNSSSVDEVGDVVVEFGRHLADRAPVAPAVVDPPVDVGEQTRHPQERGPAVHGPVHEDHRWAGGLAAPADVEAVREDVTLH